MAFMKSIQALGKSTKSNMRIMTKVSTTDKYDNEILNQQNMENKMEKRNAGKLDTTVVAPAEPQSIEQIGPNIKMLHHLVQQSAKGVKKTQKVKKYRVKIHDDCFEPSTLKVERGETVEWTLYFKIESG